MRSSPGKSTPRHDFAVEPVTHANNGVNLLTAGQSNCGTVALEPNASLEAHFAIHVEHLRAERSVGATYDGPWHYGKL
jgi:hypothetical protein